MVLPSILDAAAPVGAAKMRFVLRERSENSSSLAFTTRLLPTRPPLKYKVILATLFQHNLTQLSI